MKMRTPLEWKRIFESEEFEKEYEYAGEDLGVTLQEKETLFKVWAPTAEAVSLNLYRSGDSQSGKSQTDDGRADGSGVNHGVADDKIGTIPMKKSDKGVWEISVNENLKNRYYTYSVTVEGRTCETQDVYAKACGTNGLRSMVADLKETDPEGWEKDKYTYDSALLPVIYEVHVKDFSYAESSGIPREYRGKYKAFTIEDSTLYGRGEKNTCISYLKELGITHVHLLPCFDFGSVDEAGDFDIRRAMGSSRHSDENGFNPCIKEKRRDQPRR
ncbi:MAG: hypothetical protein NC416_08410 [Eubacterium sp.]|nr:hypothetical protein [Eubacterium sp.]